MTSSWIGIVDLAVLLAWLSPDAVAYIDPGTGSFILMWLLGGFLAILYTIKMYWRKLKTSVAGLFGGGGDHQ